MVPTPCDEGACSAMLEEEEEEEDCKLWPNTVLGCRVEVHTAGPMLSQRDDAVVYQGEGEKFARRLSKVIHGGQVVLSETAWASIQDQIPGQSQVACFAC